MSTANHEHEAAYAGARHVHVMPMRVLIAVIAALLFLTWITVAATWFDFGAANVWIALAIAVVKASLVALYFMHLRYDNLFNGIALIAALGFVVVFIGIALIDTTTYQPDITAQPTPPVRAAP